MKALAAALAVLAVAPTGASAAGPWERCGPGEFCIAPLDGGFGGEYHVQGNDPNLLDDRFTGQGTHLVVGRNAFSVRNRGLGPKGSLVDVLVFTRVRWGGTSACLRQGTSGTLQPEWLNHVRSFKWVTRTECRRHRIIAPGSRSAGPGSPPRAARAAGCGQRPAHPPSAGADLPLPAGWMAGRR
jgi:hypothetical protein